MKFAEHAADDWEHLRCVSHRNSTSLSVALKRAAPNPIWECRARSARSNQRRGRLIIRVHSLEFGEADMGGLFSEASAADVQSVLSDETFRICANSACAGVFSVFAGVRVKLVGHFSLF